MGFAKIRGVWEEIESASPTGLVLKRTGQIVSRQYKVCAQPKAGEPVNTDEPLPEEARKAVTRFFRTL